MNYSKQNENPRAKTCEPVLFKVAVVNVSTSFAGRNGRRVHTDLLLVNGHEKIRIQVDDEKFTKSARVKADWSVGDFVEAPDIRGLKFALLSPTKIRKTSALSTFVACELRNLPL